MNDKRPRLKKGTVMGEWQDERGQWWRRTVDRDTSTVFKAVVRKIDAPGGEVLGKRKNIGRAGPDETSSS